MTATSAPVFPPETFGIRMMSPKDLVPNPLNPRSKVDESTDAFAELVASIKERGLIQAIVAFPTPDGKVMIHAGHRRQRAALKGKVAEVRVDVQPPKDAGGQLVDAVIENLHREDLSVLDEATAFQSLLDAGWSQAAIAKACGKSPSHITKRLALLKLPEDIVDKVAAGRITNDTAYRLSAIRNPKVIRDLCKYGSPSGWGIESALEKQKNGDAAEKAIAKLEKAGTRVVKLSQLSNGTAALLPCPKTGVNLGVTFHAIDTPSAAHAKEPCHAMAVFPKLPAGDQTLPVCDNPAAHSKAPIAKFVGNDWRSVDSKGIKETAEANKRDAAARAGEVQKKDDPAAKQAALDAARAIFEEHTARAAERRAFVAKQIKTPGRPAQVALLQHAAAASCLDPWSSELDHGIAALMYEPDPEARKNIRIDMEPAKGDPKAAARAALACAAGFFETGLWRYSETFDQLYQYDRNPEQWVRSGVAKWAMEGYLQWLQDSGFAIGPLEKQAIA